MKSDTALLVGMILLAPIVLVLNAVAWMWRKING